MLSPAAQKTNTKANDAIVTSRIWTHYCNVVCARVIARGDADWMEFVRDSWFYLV